MWLMVLKDVWACGSVANQYVTRNVSSVCSSRDAGASACSSRGTGASVCSSRGTGATTSSSRVDCSKVCKSWFDSKKKTKTNKRLLQDSGTGRDRKTHYKESEAVIGEGTDFPPTRSDAAVAQEYVCVAFRV